MKKEFEIIVRVNVKTDKSLEDVRKALRKGTYYGLDIKNVAKPSDISIQYIQER